MTAATDPTPTEPGTEQGGEPKQQEQTFTQADVDRIVRERLAQQAKNKYGDYEDLKVKANESKTLEERLLDVEKQYAEAQMKALRSDVAAKYQIPTEDRDLFLTGTDEATLTAQAQRLAERVAAVKKSGNVAPREGGTTSTGNENSERREFVHNLFNAAE